MVGSLGIIVKGGTVSMKLKKALDDSVVVSILIYGYGMKVKYLDSRECK